MAWARGALRRQCAIEPRRAARGEPAPPSHRLATALFRARAARKRARVQPTLDRSPNARASLVGRRAPSALARCYRRMS